MPRVRAFPKEGLLDEPILPICLCPNKKEEEK
jgi:hypothetical protein